MLTGEIVGLVFLKTVDFPYKFEATSFSKQKCQNLIYANAFLGLNRLRTVACTGQDCVLRRCDGWGGKSEEGRLSSGGGRGKEGE